MTDGFSERASMYSDTDGRSDVTDAPRDCVMPPRSTAPRAPISDEIPAVTSSAQIPVIAAGDREEGTEHVFSSPGEVTMAEAAVQAETTTTTTTHIEARDWPALCGYDPREQAIQAFARVAGGAAPAVDADLADLVGTLSARLERLAAKRLTTTVTAGVYVHPRYPFLGAEIAVCDDGSILDTEVTGIGHDDPAEHDGNPIEIEAWGLEPQDVPTRVVVRVMAKLTVLRAWCLAHRPEMVLPTVAHVAVLVSGSAHALRMYRVEWDEGLARRLVDRIVRVWTNVEQGTVPPPCESEAFYEYIEARYPRHEKGRWVEADESLEKNIEGWLKYDRQIADLKKLRQSATNQITRAVRDAEGVRGGEGAQAWRLPWRFVNGRKALNEARLREELVHLLGERETDSLIEKCRLPGGGYRKLGPLWRPKSSQV